MILIDFKAVREGRLSLDPMTLLVSSTGKLFVMLHSVIILGVLLAIFNILAGGVFLFITNLIMASIAVYSVVMAYDGNLRRDIVMICTVKSVALPYLVFFLALLIIIASKSWLVLVVILLMICVMFCFLIPIAVRNIITLEKMSVEVEKMREEDFRAGKDSEFSSMLMDNKDSISDYISNNKFLNLVNKSTGKVSNSKFGDLTKKVVESLPEGNLDDVREETPDFSSITKKLKPKLKQSEWLPWLEVYTHEDVEDFKIIKAPEVTEIKFNAKSVSKVEYFVGYIDFMMFTVSPEEKEIIFKTAEKYLRRDMKEKFTEFTSKLMKDTFQSEELIEDDPMLTWNRIASTLEYRDNILQPVKCKAEVIELNDYFNLWKMLGEVSKKYNNSLKCLKEEASRLASLNIQLTDVKIKDLFDFVCSLRSELALIMEEVSGDDLMNQKGFLNESTMPPESVYDEYFDRNGLSAKKCWLGEKFQS